MPPRLKSRQLLESAAKEGRVLLSSEWEILAQVQWPPRLGTVCACPLHLAEQWKSPTPSAQLPPPLESKLGGLLAGGCSSSGGYQVWGAVATPRGVP